MNHGVHARSSSSPDGVSFVVVHRGGHADNRLRAFPSSPDGRRRMRARARVANEPGARRAETRPTPTPARERRRRNARSRSMFARDVLARSTFRSAGGWLGVAFLPTVYAYVQPTAPWMKVSERVDARPPLVDARGTRRESRDAIKNIIIARARRSSFVDVIARARSPAPARDHVDRARCRTSSGRRLRRLAEAFVLRAIRRRRRPANLEG